MAEKPILFSGPMVRALIAGKKTQTRRICRFTAGGHLKEPGGHRRWHRRDPESVLACPYGQPGDELWVRETWEEVVNSRDQGDHATWDGSFKFVYRATEPHAVSKWRPAIFMPRRVSRLQLVIRDVRVQRLQEISEEDALAEGVRCWVCNGPCDGTSENDCECFHNKNARTSFSVLWDTINGTRAPWWSNPWVWAVSFEVCA